MSKTTFTYVAQTSALTSSWLMLTSSGAFICRSNLGKTGDKGIISICFIKQIKSDGKKNIITVFFHLEAVLDFFRPNWHSNLVSSFTGLRVQGVRKLQYLPIGGGFIQPLANPVAVRILLSEVKNMGQRETREYRKSGISSSTRWLIKVGHGLV